MSRFTDRSFILTVILMALEAYLASKGTPAETLAALSTSAAPFILGEKYKDAQSAKSVAPQNVNIGTAGNVAAGAQPTGGGYPDDEISGTSVN